MKLFKNWWRTILSVFLLTSCIQPPAPVTTRAFKTYGSLEVSLDASGEAKAKFNSAKLRPQATTPLPDNAFTFTRKYATSFDIDSSNERYISATFEVRNNSGAPIDNLNLIAYNQAGNSLAGTAIKNLVNFGGTALTTPTAAQSIYPVQSVKRNGLDVMVDPDNADFQGFSPAEASTIGQTARAAQIIGNTDTPLEYGFVARNADGRRTIGDGETGLITLTLRFERPNSVLETPYRFVMTFVIASDALTRVTRGINEETFQAESRATALNATELMLIGPDGDTSSTTALTTIRLDNARIGLEPTYLVKSALFMRDAQPSQIFNDQDNTVLIRGINFTSTTSFFIQSSKLEIKSQTATEATVIIPKGLIPSQYGIMAANNNGQRATLYPALTIAQGAAPRELDPEPNYNSFIEGYVLDNQTKRPIPNAKVRIPGLETTTTSDGYYLLQGVPSGRQAIEITKANYETVYRIAEVPISSNGNSSNGQTLTMKLAELEPKSEQVTMIGAAGGIHYASSLGNAGPFLKIPAGALSKDTPIQFTHLRTANTLPELPEDGYYLAFAHLGPTGLVFKKPATLFLPLQPGVVMRVGEVIDISYFDSLQAKWVDDITNGKISKINGKLFLEYEINHFTWIGGQAPRDPVKFCIEDQNSNPLANISTNFGASQPNGCVDGSTPRGGTDPIRLRPIVPPNMDCTLPEDMPRISGIPVNFPAPVVCNVNEPLAEEGGAGGSRDPCNPPNQIAPRSVAKPQSVTSASILVTEKDFSSYSVNLRNFKSAGTKPESIKIMVGSRDWTKQARVKTLDNDSLEVAIKFTEPFQAQSNLKLSVEAVGYNNKVVRSELITDVIPRLQAPKTIIPLIVPDDIALTTATPYTVDGPRGTLVVARASDISGGFITTKVPIKALDTKGQLLSSFSTDYPVSLGASVSAGSAKFENGVARVPIKILVNNGGNQTKLKNLFTVSSSGANGATRLNISSGVRPQTNGSGCDQAPVGGSTPISLDGTTNIFDTIANLPLVGGLLDWMNTTKGLEFDIFGLNFTFGDFVTLGWGVIPLVGDATVLAENFYNYLIGKGADVVEATLAGVSLAFDATGNVAAGTAGSAMLFIFKVSKGGRSIFRDWMADAIRACTAKPSACYKELSDAFTYLVELLARGGATAIRNAEEQIARIAVSLPRGLADVRQALSRLATYPALDALGNSITIERLLGVMDDVDDVPGFDRVVNKISTAGTEGNIRGAFGELERAKGLRRLGATDVEFKGEVQFLDANGVTVKRDIDISYQDAQGNLIFEEVKAGNITSIYFDPINADGRKNISRAQSLVEAARKNGAIPRWNVPDCSTVSSAALTFLTVTGIEVYDANLGKC